MAPPELPPPDELRRRLRAARALAGIDDLGELARRVHSTARLSERTLRKLEIGESDPTVPQLREIADTCGVAFEWFTHPDLGHAPAEAERRDARLEALEARMKDWETQLEQMREAARALAGGSPAPETVRSSPPRSQT